MCPQSYILSNTDDCIHSLWPLDASKIFGMILLMCITVLCSLSGLGGGGVIIPSLIMFFDYLPKDATIVVFSCIVGTTLGSISNLVQNSIDKKPIINYEVLFISMPIIFAGAVVGVIFNKILPSISICLIIILIFFLTIKKTVNRFLTQYNQENMEIRSNINHFESERHERINPFENQRVVYILKNLSKVVFLVVLFAFIKGSEKFPSIIGIEPCSLGFWSSTIISFIVIGIFARRNLTIARSWGIKQQLLGEQIKQYTNPIEDHKQEIVLKSLGAGVLSGFGLGGGVILVPMYRNIGCTSLSGAGSVCFGVFLTALINTIQGVSIGVIQPIELLFFTGILTASTYLFSQKISKYLKKKNRMSYITGLFIIFLTFGTINIPISIYQKYKQSGYNIEILLGFGSPC